jgi:integrase
MRRGELLGLRWGDLDLNRATLAVAAVAALREHRRRQVAARLAGGPAWEDSDYVFVSTTGRPLSPAALRSRWRILLRRAGLPHLPLRNLRHAHATVLLAAGVYVKAVQERLGHSDPAITLRVYTEVTGETHRQVAALVDTLLAGDGAAGGALGAPRARSVRNRWAPTCFPLSRRGVARVRTIGLSK